MNGGTALQFGAGALALIVLASIPTVDPVIDLFFGMLRRIPTTAELAEWAPVVAADQQSGDGAGIEALSQDLFASSEYLDRVS